MVSADDVPGFLENGDNNLVASGIRPAAVGKKNSLSMKPGPDNAERSIYSIIETRRR
jgi:hypothetical protein